jgi:hypothetical protein
MKKVFLSLAVVAVLTVVSCKSWSSCWKSCSWYYCCVDSVAVDTTAIAVDSAAVESCCWVISDTNKKKAVYCNGFFLTYILEYVTFKIKYWFILIGELKIVIGEI